jgi:hypothetical protein
MNVICVVVQGDLRIPCDQVPRPVDASSCIKPVEYVYQISNICDPNLNTNCDTAVVSLLQMIYQ